jgi:hypothetical protein
MQHEAGCEFTFDFRRVYWNSRLQTEHDRLVSLFAPCDVIADVFAGVGPFAIPAARKGCAVWANDLNPASYEFLRKNVVKNRVSALQYESRLGCQPGLSGFNDCRWRTWWMLPAWMGVISSGVLSSDLCTSHSSHMPFLKCHFAN